MVFKNYYNNIIKYDLINKFNYVLNNKIPYIKKVVITIPLENQRIKTAVSSSLILKFFSGNNVKFSKKKKTKIYLKLKKNEISSCQIILSKNCYDYLILKLIHELLQNKAVFFTNSHYISFNFDKSSFFSQELEMFYAYFRDISKINLSIIFKSCSIKEVTVLLQSIKINSKFI